MRGSLEKFFLSNPQPKICVFDDWDDEVDLKDTIECSCKTHNSCVSEYPREWVPRSKFFRNDFNDDYKMCIDCRIYRRNTNKRCRDNYYELLSRSKPIDGLMICANTKHKSHSDYPFDAVPIENFMRKGPGIPHKTCIDCRKHERIIGSRSHEKKHAKPLPDGQFICVRCGDYYSFDKIGNTTDGDQTKCCVDCIFKERDIYRNRKLHVREMIMERIMRTGFSCVFLKEIHLQELPNGPRGIRRIRVVDGGVIFNGKEYHHLEFVRVFKEQLEIRHLQLDHLPEDEFKMLHPYEIWHPKYASVGDIKNTAGRVEEMAKCQLVSGLGHIIISSKRIDQKHLLTGTTRKRTRPLLHTTKQIWVDNYKLTNNCRCEYCGQENTHEPLTFTHFDHINIEEKTDTVSNMVCDKNISLEQLQDEVKKCRLLCMHCHAIHTIEQHASGVLEKKRSKTKKHKLNK